MTLTHNSTVILSAINSHFAEETHVFLCKVKTGYFFQMDGQAGRVRNVLKKH